MKFTALDIPGAWKIELQPRVDHRGYFMRCYDETLFQQHGLQTRWLQENQSLSREKYTVRGLHFQRSPSAETKLVRAISGELFDVMVDLRIGSPTFGKWYGAALTADNGTILYIPKGCAHGFLTLSENAIIAYKVDAVYAPECEGCLHYNDNTVAIDWPLPSSATVCISEKDANAGTLAALNANFNFNDPGLS